MKETQLVAKLAELPVERLDELRLMAAIVMTSFCEVPIKTCERWIENCNAALELKEAERLRGYTEDVEFSFV